MSYSASYVPLVNHHMRFYFTDPNRTEFENPLCEKQFNACRDVMRKLSKEDLDMVKSIITGHARIRDTVSDYSISHMVSPIYIYGVLRAVAKEIAIALEYVYPDSASEEAL